jgi:hypothetical protein
MQRINSLHWTKLKYKYGESTDAMLPVMDGMQMEVEQWHY